LKTVEIDVRTGAMGAKTSGIAERIDATPAITADGAIAARICATAGRTGAIVAKTYAIAGRIGAIAGDNRPPHRLR
jgi:hypothetical protein